MHAALENLFTRATDLARRAGETLIRATDRARDTRYFDAGQYPWARVLETHWRDIRGELDALLAEPVRIPTFQEVSREQHVVSNDARWRTYFLYVFGTRIEANCARCPRTTTLLRSVPGLGNAMFSILLPGKHIPPHRGPYKGLLRYHLALRVPEPADRCWIDVEGERRHWREGQSLVFDDSFTHSAANEAADLRVVLFLDFARPLPPLVSSLNRAVIRLIAATEFARRPIAVLKDGIPAGPEARGALD